MEVYRAVVTFLILTGEMDFCLSLFFIILCYIVGYDVISVSKLAINNPLISKEYSCDFIH